MLKSDLHKNAVVAYTYCIIGRSCHSNYIIFTMIKYLAGMMLPYFVVAVLNALIIIQMAKYRRLREGISANVDTKSDDSAQR